jgi:NTP pyrophosphatase (non-canonical NTP hydrolase)
MGQFKDTGSPALALAEECAEVIQVITKCHRFNGRWDEIPPGQDINKWPHKTRWEQLESEMEDLIYQWERLKAEKNSFKPYVPQDVF